jgi:catechol-2,3-dioxygenase
MTSLPDVQFRHAGIHATDLDGLVEFYCTTLGFVVADEGVASFGNRIVFLTQTHEEHHQLVLLDGRPEDIPFNPINQLSFKLDRLTDLKTFYRLLSDRGVGGLMAVDHGNAWSLYFRDPEQNFLELYVDTPFHTPQPCRGDLDLTLPETEILQRTEAFCRSRPDFATREEWHAAIRNRIANQRA